MKRANLHVDLQHIEGGNDEVGGSGAEHSSGRTHAVIPLGELLYAAAPPYLHRQIPPESDDANELRS